MVIVDPTLCGPHNGTFLCDNNHCVYESWRCDGTNDCGDFSDEGGCSRKFHDMVQIAKIFETCKS